MRLGVIESEYLRLRNPFCNILLFKLKYNLFPVKEIKLKPMLF